MSVPCRRAATIVLLALPLILLDLPVCVVGCMYIFVSGSVCGPSSVSMSTKVLMSE